MARIGIITALLPEAACLTTASTQTESTIALDDHTTMIVCGIGAERALRATRTLIEAGIDGLISWGTAAALASNIQSGDLIVPETVLAVDNETIYLQSDWRKSIIKRLTDCPGDIYLGQLTDSIRVLSSITEKSLLYSQSGALAVDMESASIASLATEHHIPCVVLRAITDSAIMTIPDAIMTHSNAYGQVPLLRLVSTMLLDPRQIRPLIKLAKGFRTAAKTLKWIGQRRAEILRYE